MFSHCILLRAASHNFPGFLFKRLNIDIYLIQNVTKNEVINFPIVLCFVHFGFRLKNCTPESAIAQWCN